MTPVSELGELSARVENALKNDCLETIEQIKEKSDEYFMKLPNFGRKSLRELREVIELWEGKRTWSSWVPVVLPHPQSRLVVEGKRQVTDERQVKAAATRQRKAEEMVRRWRAGESYADIAQAMKMYSHHAVANIIQRQLYPPQEPTPEEIEARLEKKEEMAARRFKVYDMRQNGKSYKEIGEALNISCERVRQIYERYLRKNDRPAWRELEKLRRERRTELYYRPEKVAQRERDRIEWEQRNKTHLIMVRYFDQEENAEDLAREAGWTMDEMNAHIAEYRANQWVTMTEYNKQMAERRRMWTGLINDRT